MRKINIFSILILNIAIMCSCSSDNKKEVELDSKVTTEKITIDTHIFTQWQYFAFDAEGKVKLIGEDTYPSDTKAETEKGKDAEWKVRSDWDFALNRMSMRTNSGASGDFKGGLYKTEFADFEEVDQSGLTDLDFTVDTVTDLNMVLSIATMPPPRASVGMSPIKVLNRMGAMPPVYNKINKVFVLRTAKEKYVLFKVINYYDKKGKGGNFKLKYHFVN